MTTYLEKSGEGDFSFIYFQFKLFPIAVITCSRYVGLLVRYAAGD